VPRQYSSFQLVPIEQGGSLDKIIYRLSIYPTSIYIVDAFRPFTPISTKYRSSKFLPCCVQNFGANRGVPKATYIHKTNRYQTEVIDNEWDVIEPHAIRWLIRMAVVSCSNQQVAARLAPYLPVHPAGVSPSYSSAVCEEVGERGVSR
jgi:hypothetical protein